MKKLLKSIGATIGYLAVYLLMSVAAAIAAIIAMFVTNIFGPAQAVNPSQLFSQGLEGFILQNTTLLLSITNIATLGCYIVIIKLSKKKIRERLDLNPVAFGKLWPILPLGLTLNMVTSYIIDLLPIPEHLLDEYSQSAGFLNEGSFVTLFISVVIAAPLLEEVLLRGLIMKALQNSMPVVVALILQAIIFGLMHGQIIWAAYASVLGIILGVLKLRYESLYACLLLHFSFNASSLILDPLLYLIQNNFMLNMIAMGVSLLMTVFLVYKIYQLTKKENRIDGSVFIS